MINRRSFLKGAAALVATPVLARLPFESKVEASPPGLKYALAFPRKDICGNFSSQIITGSAVKNHIKINTRFKRIYLTARMSFHDFFCYIQDRLELPDHLHTEVFLARIAPGAFQFRNDWDFGDDRSRVLLMDASWDSYTNIRTIGTIQGNNFGIYYRVNHGKWRKFFFHYPGKANVVNEAVYREPKSRFEFVLVDEKKAVIVSDFFISELYHANTFVPLFGTEEDSPIKRFRWNRRMTVYDAKQQLNKLWIKDI